MYYDRACDPCILPALNEIASEQASPTTNTIARTTMLMDYLHTYPHGVLHYYASDMILKITSEATYLVQPKAHSRAAAHYHLGWRNSKRTNGPVDILCKTIKNVVGSKHACPMRTALEELGHPQSITGSPFEADNSTAQGILTSKMRQKLSKSFDMRYWLLDEGPNQPGPIRSHLGPRQVQLGRLLHQASPTMASSQHALQVHPTSQLRA
jgi:hypothetical protein